MGAVFEASYVGNKGVDIEVIRNINAVPNQYLSTLNFRDTAQNTFLSLALPNPFQNLLPAASGAPSTFTGTTISRQQLLRPYPQFGDINTTSNEGYSWYHSLQFHAEKRFAKNLSLIGSYTFSKFMQATELPLNFTGADYFLTSGDLGLPIDQRTLTRAFNANAFVTASAAQPVSHLRVNPYRFSTLSGPRTNNIDLSLIKDTSIREGMRLRFSAQALNAFNHPLLPTPNLTPSNALFGATTGSTQANYPRNLPLELKLFF